MSVPGSGPPSGPPTDPPTDPPTAPPTDLRDRHESAAASFRDTGSIRELEHSRATLLPAWHAMFALVWALAAALTMPAAGAAGTGTAVGAGVLFAALGAAYLGCGAPALAGPIGPASVQRQGRRYRCALGYVATIWITVVVLMALVPRGDAWVLFLALFAQMWTMLPVTEAIVGTVIGSLATSVTAYLVDPNPDTVRVVTMGALMVLLSLGLGLLIDRIFGEAYRRAGIIDRLRDAQTHLAAAQRREGAYAERERVSREIHDTLAQGFTSIAALASATRSALTRGDLEVSAERLDLIEHTARDNLSEARLLLAEMAPPALHERTLVEAVERLAATVDRACGLRGEVDIIGQPERLPTTLEVLVVRTVQEALANIRRHAHADGYRIRLDYAPQRLRVTVADDGVGFDPALTARGFGLSGASARAAECAASLTVTSRVGEGTTLELRVPRGP